MNFIFETLESIRFCDLNLNPIMSPVKANAFQGSDTVRIVNP